MAKPTSGRGSGASLKRILGVVAVLAAASYLAVSSANKVMSRAFDLAFDDIETERRGAWFTWDGDLVADNVALYLDEDATQVMRFRRARLETPGWLWIAMTAFHPKRREAELSRMHLTLTDGSFDTTETVWLYELDPLSLDTGTPWSAQGCLKHSSIRHAQLAGMGLSPGPTTLDFDYRIEDGRILRTITLDNPGVSRALYERTELFANLGAASGLADTFGNALRLDSARTQVAGERYELQDAGFVQARNAFCAKEDGIDTAQFVQRHVDTIVRIAEVGGVGFDAATRTRYTRFARDGGTLTLEFRFPTPIDIVDYHTADFESEAFAGTEIVLGVDGQRGPVGLDLFEPRPLADYETTDTPTWVLLDRERAQAAPAAPAVAASTNARDDAQRGVYKVFADPLASRSAAGASADMTTAPAAPTPAAPVAASAPPPVASAVPAVATPPAAVPPAATSGPVTTAPAAPARPRDLAWGDLAAQKGQRLRVWTKQSPPRNVELIEVGASQIRVKALLGGGHAQYSISRQSFSRARRLD